MSFICTCSTLLFCSQYNDINKNPGSLFRLGCIVEYLSISLAFYQCSDQSALDSLISR